MPALHDREATVSCHFSSTLYLTQGGGVLGELLEATPSLHLASAPADSIDLQCVGLETLETPLPLAGVSFTTMPYKSRQFYVPHHPPTLTTKWSVPIARVRLCVYISLALYKCFETSEPELLLTGNPAVRRQNTSNAP